MQGYLDSAELAGFDEDNDESEWRLSRHSCAVLWAQYRAMELVLAFSTVLWAQYQLTTSTVLWS